MRSRCYIKQYDFSWKFDEGIFLGYSTKRKAYKCYNEMTNNIIESANVKINEYFKQNDESGNKES